MRLLRTLLTLSAFAGSTAFCAAAQAATPPGLPAGVVQISPCVATMGEHWANPHNLPFGPTYGVFNGQIVFTEVMIDQKSFEAGRGWRNILQPLSGHAIDHVDIAFNPRGHEGYPIPHYDIHAYYVPHSVHEAFCPHGIPNPEAP